MNKPLKDYLFECLAGVPSEWNAEVPNAHFWDLQQCEGFVEIEIQNYGTLTRRMGQTGNVETGIKRVRITSPVDQTVMLSMGDDKDTNDPGGGDPAGGPLPIQGQYVNEDSTGPFDNTSPRLVSIGMLERFGVGGNVRSLPVSPTAFGVDPSGNGAYDLAVGVNDKGTGFVWAAPDSGSLLVKGLQGCAIRISNINALDPWTGQVQLFYGASSVAVDPVGYWDVNGVYHSSGIIRQNGTYFLNVAASWSQGVTISWAAGGTGAGMSILATSSFHKAGPVQLTAPLGIRQRLVYNGPFIGVLGSGFNMVLPGVAGKFIRVFGYAVSLEAAADFQFYSVDGLGQTPVSVRWANSVAAQEVDEPVFETEPGDDLQFWCPDGAAVGSYQLRYQLVDAS